MLIWASFTGPILGLAWSTTEISACSGLQFCLKIHGFQCKIYAKLCKIFPDQKYRNMFYVLGKYSCTVENPTSHSPRKRQWHRQPVLDGQQASVRLTKSVCFSNCRALIWPYLLYPDAYFPQLCRKVIILKPFTFCQIESKLACGPKSY